MKSQFSWALARKGSCYDGCVHFSWLTWTLLLTSLSGFVGVFFISLVKLKVFDDFASRVTTRIVKFESIVKLREDFLQLLQGYNRTIVFKDLSCPYFEDFLVVDSLVIFPIFPPERENFAFVREDFHGLLVTVGVVTHVAESHGPCDVFEHLGVQDIR